MLILTRKEDQSVVFPNCGIVVHVLSVRGRTIKLGFEAPLDVEVLRGELQGRTGGNALTGSAPNSTLESESVHRRTAAETCMAKEIHDLKNRLNCITLSIQLYNDLRSMGQDRAADRTLDNLLDKIAEIDRDWGDYSQVRMGRGDWVASVNPEASLELPFGLRLLVVDDDANERELLAGVMEMKGCRCTTAASGNEALDVIEHGGEFDFAILDMHMPDLDGPSTLRAIRKCPRTSRLKVFSVSGTSPSEFGSAIGGDGFDGWLPKPLNPATLWRHMQESLQRGIKSAEA